MSKATETKIDHPVFGHVIFHNLSSRQLDIIKICRPIQGRYIVDLLQQIKEQSQLIDTKCKQSIKDAIDYQDHIDRLEKEVRDIKEEEHLVSIKNIEYYKAIKETKETLSILIKDGYPTESSINFEVLTGKYYYDKIKKLLNEE